MQEKLLIICKTILKLKKVYWPGLSSHRNHLVAKNKCQIWRNVIISDKEIWEKKKQFHS